MSGDLVLKPFCEACGKTTDLFGIECKHMTLCRSCGGYAASTSSRCPLCGAVVAKLIREYNVRASSNTEKKFFIGSFSNDLPPFSKKKNPDKKWSLSKEGLQGRQVTEVLREEYKNKPWNLEDETGQYKFQGQLEGLQTTTYYLLIMIGKEFHAFPAGSWYNFKKKTQYKQLTLEEAEEMLSKRKNNAAGYERWMMKAAASGANAFPEMNKNDPLSTSMAYGNSLKKGKNHHDGENSDKGEEDEDGEEDRKSRLEHCTKGIDDDEDCDKWVDIDLDEDDIEKGDDWEHEEIFTDDDEAVGITDGPYLDPEIPAPPEIKQYEDDDDEEEEEEEEDGLSQSGKELKKLLRLSAGLNESEGEDEEESSIKDETSSIAKPSETLGSSRPAARTGSTPSASTIIGSTPNTSAVTEDEIRAVLLTSNPVTIQSLVSNFKDRLQTSEEKKAFTETLKRISKIQKRNDDHHRYVVLREK